MNIEPNDRLELNAARSIPQREEYSYEPSAIPLWELAAQISAQVPDEEWKKLPTDLARRLDYYQQQKREREKVRNCQGLQGK